MELKDDFSFDQFEQLQSEYLACCNKILFDFFKDFLQNGFLFSALTYNKRNEHIKEVKIVKGTDRFTDYNFNEDTISNVAEIRVLLNSYLDEVRKGVTISLTKILLDKLNFHDLFLINSKSSYCEKIIGDGDENAPARIFSYSLDDLDFDAEVSTFSTNNAQKIDKFISFFENSCSENKREKYAKYIWNYKQLADSYSAKNENGNFYIHFIKPYIEEFDCNLLLSLATNRILSEDELVIVNLFIHRIVSQTAIEKVIEVKHHATRAAISQAMARNASHNSNHVMNRLTDGKVLAGLNIKDFKSYKSKINLNSDDAEMYQQLALYINYLKCRMDYLSDITFGVPVMHTNRRVYSELYKDFDKVRLLLEYISGLDKFEYEIKFTLTDRNDITKEITEATDFSIALPNDLLGSQAFYNILENIIRNTAKHNQNKDDSSTTTFTINFSEVRCDSKEHFNGDKLTKQKCLFYQVEVFDNIELTKTKNLEKDEAETYKSYTGSEEANPLVIDWLVANQNIKLNESVLDSNKNKLRNTSLGLLEMEASAAYLRKLDVINIEADENTIKSYTGIHNKNGDLSILKAFNKNGCLGYRFFVSKPTEFLFVGDFDLEQREFELLADKGIWLRTEEYFISELENKEVFNHQFIIYENDSTREICNKYATRLPTRTIKTDGSLDFRQVNFSFPKIEEWVWQKWFDKIKGNFTDINVFTSYQAAKHSEQGSFNIAFSNHNKTWQANENDFINDEKKSNYLESLSTNAQKKLPNFRNRFAEYLYNDGEPFPLLIKQKLFEAAIVKILVIDERIQRFSKATYDSDNIKVPNQNIFEYSNVIIPANINLGADNFSSEIITAIENYVDEKIRQCQFLLIHYSILERMYESSTEKINKRLSEWSKKIRVVITSGRGKPPNLPTKEVCFIHLSPIMNAFVENRSKYAMNYLLNSARK